MRGRFALNNTFIQFRVSIHILAVFDWLLSTFASNLTKILTMMPIQRNQDLLARFFSLIHSFSPFPALCLSNRVSAMTYYSRIVIINQIYTSNLNLDKNHRCFDWFKLEKTITFHKYLVAIYKTFGYSPIIDFHIFILGYLQTRDLS